MDTSLSLSLSLLHTWLVFQMFPHRPETLVPACFGLFVAHLSARYSGRNEREEVNVCLLLGKDANRRLDPTTGTSGLVDLTELMC